MSYGSEKLGMIWQDLSDVHSTLHPTTTGAVSLRAPTTTQWDDYQWPRYQAYHSGQSSSVNGSDSDAGRKLDEQMMGKADLFGYSAVNLVYGYW